MKNPIECTHQMTTEARRKSKWHFVAIHIKWCRRESGKNSHHRHTKDDWGKKAVRMYRRKKKKKAQPVSYNKIALQDGWRGLNNFRRRWRGPRIFFFFFRWGGSAGGTYRHHLPSISTHIASSTLVHIYNAYCAAPMKRPMIAPYAIAIERRSVYCVIGGVREIKVLNLENKKGLLMG